MELGVSPEKCEICISSLSSEPGHLRQNSDWTTQEKAVLIQEGTDTLYVALRPPLESTEQII